MFDNMVKKFTEFVDGLNEGLIKSYKIEDYKNILFNFLSDFNYNYTIRGDYSFQIIFNQVYTKKEYCDLFEKINNILGYYPTKYTIFKNNMDKDFIFDEDEFYINIKNFHTSINIIFDSKYIGDSNESAKDVPDVLYHLTPSENVDNIIKKGLIPHTKRKNFADNLQGFF